MQKEITRIIILINLAIVIFSMPNTLQSYFCIYCTFLFAITYYNWNKTIKLLALIMNCIVVLWFIKQPVGFGYDYMLYGITFLMIFDQKTIDKK